MKRQFIFSILLLSAVHVVAQQDSTASKPQFKIGVNYNSGINYFGRTDSLKSSAVFPMAELWFTPDLYINAAPIFVNNAVQQFEYAGTVATLGFQHVSDHWITGLYAMKPFYPQSSVLVQSALKGQAGFNLSYLNPILNLNGGADVKFSDQTDIGLTAGVDHTIVLGDATKGVWVIDPSVYAYAGTQHFQQTYYRRRSGGLLNLPGNNERVTEDVQKLNILAWEASVPVVYSKGNWMLLATPAYVLPQNLVEVEGRPDLTEQGENMFYVSLGVKYSF